MAPKDPYLARVNRGLRDLGYAVSLEVSPSGRRMRLRATLPLADGSWKQQRIATALEYPGDLERARKLAEELGRDVELHRRGLDPFPEQRWLTVASGQGLETVDTISGIEALRRTEIWWTQQRKRGVSAAVSWATDYAAPLKPLLQQQKVDLRVLQALVKSTPVGTRARRRVSIAAVAVARSIELGPQAVQDLKDLGKGYSPQKDAAPRDPLRGSHNPAAALIAGSWVLSILPTCGSSPRTTSASTRPWAGTRCCGISLSSGWWSLTLARHWLST